MSSISTIDLHSGRCHPGILFLPSCQSRVVSCIYGHSGTVHRAYIIMPMEHTFVQLMDCPPVDVQGFAVLSGDVGNCECVPLTDIMDAH